MTRDEFITRLGEQYRRVLAGLADEREFGRQLQRGRLTEEEFEAVWRLAKCQEYDTVLEYTTDWTNGGERLLHVQEVW